MATVVIQKRHRKDRCSYLIYYKDPATGRRKYYKTFQRHRDAQIAANELRGLLDTGKTPETNKSKARLNLFSYGEIGSSLKNGWDMRQQRSELSESTVKGYRYFLDYTPCKTFDKKLLCEISYNDIIKYRNAIALNTSNVMANRSLFILKQVFAHGLEMNAIKNDPVKEIPYLSEREHERNEFLMPDALRKLIEASQKLRAKYYLPAMIYLGAEHGASKQEVLDLKWSDVNFDYSGIGLIRFFRTKTKLERTEFLMPRTRQALIEWHQHQEWMNHRKKIKDNGSGLVFCRLDGTPIRRFDKAWREARKIAGFDGLHSHDLRHTFCSNLLLSGVDLKDVKEMIGHRDLSMTDRYAHLNISRKLLSQEKLARFYSSNNGLLEPSGEHIGNTEG